MCNSNEASIIMHVKNNKIECPTCGTEVTFDHEDGKNCPNCSTMVFPKDQRLVLCVDCAREYGLPTHDTSADIFSQKASIDKLLETFFEIKKNSSCNVCGRTLVDIRKTKTFGCPQCYITFNSEVRKILGENLKYRGSYPKEHFVPQTNILQQRMLLQKQLSDSVEAEDFESAAKLRDKLKALDNKNE